MKYHHIRYFYEHELLKSWFYQKKFSFVGLIIQQKGFFYRAFCDILNKQGIEPNVREEDFSVSMVPVSGSARIAELRLPEPREINECRRMYFCFDPKFERPALFTLEYSLQCDCLCGWTANDVHNNYGVCRLEEAFGRVCALYTEGSVS